MGDFGISKFDLFSIKRTLTQTLGLETTPAYVAPEVIKGEASSTKADIWALGIIFYQLISGLKHPFQSKDVFAMNIAISENQYHTIPKPVSPLV